MTVKSLKKGHPWVTRDKFSEKFPQKGDFIELFDPQNKSSLGHFIKDPKHPKVVARFWSKEKPSFERQLRDRVENAIQNRESLTDRENFYLVFGEADALPGLFIQKLGDHILVQTHCFFWEQAQQIIYQVLDSVFKHDYYWWQTRIPGVPAKNPAPRFKEQPTETFIKEFGVRYLLNFSLNHDVGIFTDISTIRKHLLPLLSKSNSLLNLFSYTGAFSLLPLANNPNCSVVSVDASNTYAQWLERNLEMLALERFGLEKSNSEESSPKKLKADKQPQGASLNHQMVVRDVPKYLKALTKENKQFDSIICDPPSVFSSNKKRIKILDFYRAYLPELMRLTAIGGRLVLILNTHSTKKERFDALIKESLKDFNYRTLKLDNQTEDCPRLRGFPEGNYLKVVVLSPI